MRDSISENKVEKLRETVAPVSGLYKNRHTRANADTQASMHEHTTCTLIKDVLSSKSEEGKKSRYRTGLGSRGDGVCV